MAYQLLSDLSLDKRNWKIQVRVSNIWKLSNATWTGFNCILIDENEMRIEASASRDDTELFDSLLQEGIIYEISGFKVIPRKKKFRSVPNEFMLRLNRATSAVKISSENILIPMYKFTFTNFDKLQHLIHNDEDLIDVIGQIIGVGSLHGRTEQQRRTLEIQDVKKEQILVTLWDKHAIGFDADGILHRNDPIIAVFAGMTVRTWEGRVCLSSSFSTRYYIGLNIPEVQAFLDKITETITVRPIIPRQNASNTSMVELATETVATIADLLNLDTSKTQNVRFNCKGTLVNIDASEGWWYRACPKCKSAVQTYRSTVWCNRCSETDIVPIPWYKLNITVEDRTGKANFIMFGKSVQDLIQIPVGNVAGGIGSDRSTLPPVFQKVLGKDYLFTVISTRRSTSESTKSFKVIVMKLDTDTATPNKEIDITESTTGTSSAAQGQLLLQSNALDTITEQETDITPSPFSEVSEQGMPLQKKELANQADNHEPLQKKQRNMIVKKEKKD